MTDTIDTTATDIGEMEHGMAIAAPTRPNALAVTPSVGAGELVERLAVIKEAMETAMVKDVDYGVIPGTGSKPTLLKPGAEKLSVLFQLDVQLSNHKTWNGDHLTVESSAIVYHIPTGLRVGFGEGLCTSRERKYGKRKQERECPACGVAAIIKGREEYGGGWVCFRKKNGCGAKYRDGDDAIESQAVGEVENPDLPDTWNTVVKMAEKRARVDAVLAVTGASAIFTQDVEDLGSPEPPAPEPPPVPACVAKVKRLLRAQKVTTAGIRNLLRAAGVPVTDKESPVPLVEALTEAQAQSMLDWLNRPISDVPSASEGEFVHEPAAPEPDITECSQCGYPPDLHVDGECPDPAAQMDLEPKAAA